MIHTFVVAAGVAGTSARLSAANEIVSVMAENHRKLLFCSSVRPMVT